MYIFYDIPGTSNYSDVRYNDHCTSEDFAMATVVAK